MDQDKVDGGLHLKKNTAPKCEFHPLQTPKYYCSDSKCRTSLCLICIKTHPKEHLPNLATIQDIKSQTLDCLKKEALNRFDKFFNDILKSKKMNGLFKEAFGNLMQQNTSVDLDDEDVADILADTLQRKYFEKGIVITEKIQEESNIKLSRSDLITFDYKFDNKEDEDDDHERNKREFCCSSAEFYCQEQLETYYAESKEQVILWSIKDQTLLCKDLINPEKSKKYKVPLPFRFLTVLESEEKLLFVTESENKLTVYSIEERKTPAAEDKEESLKSQNKDDHSNSDDDIEEDEFLENYPPLKICSEFSLEENIVFPASDSTNHLFITTQRETFLTAHIYSISQGLELSQLLSFEPFGLPKKVIFDRLNNLFFILSNDLLHVYRYHATLATYLQIIFAIKTTDFRWHQITRKLLLVDSKKLYQFGKGKFRLIRTMTGSEIKPLGLTSQGVFCDIYLFGLYLLSQKNPNEKNDLILPSVEDQMERLQERSRDRLSGTSSDIEPTIGELRTTCNVVEILAETPNSLLIYANIKYYQEASEKLPFNISHSWGEFGGTIYTRYLLKYNLSQKEYKILEDAD